ncbi:MAG TPA: fatty acid oxidation complex subunit alpha FadJ [Polyangia bacterium]|nr:fatty acid oxidation complex subunit alpha FadJ [Polyangia bacterium]
MVAEIKQSLHLDVGADGIATLTIDVPGHPVNTLTEQLGIEMAEVLTRIERDPAIAAVVITGKPTGFLAGADLNMLRGFKTAARATAASRGAQLQMARIAALGKPMVAAIHGPALGGGCELALASHYRIATEQAELGLPEAKLGLIPGAGGTQRLPRLIGIRAALEIILQGRSVKAAKARKLGLVDEVVPHPILLEVAHKRAGELARGERTRAEPRGRLDAERLQELALEDNPIGRRVLFAQARKRVQKETGGHYPAPQAALEAVQMGYEDGEEAGYAAEAERFGQMVASPVAARLIEIFFETTELKKDTGAPPEVKPHPVAKLAVLGAGLMGGGITYVSAAVGVPVRMRDQDDEALRKGLAYVRGILDQRVERKSLKARAAADVMALVRPTTDYSGFASADLVIEAVFEDLAVKQKVLRETEAATRADTIFASNTSSIPITRIAEAAARPELVVGMHFFSPVHKMPLLEVIKTAKTADWVVATAVAFGKHIGKTVIVVRDGVGFYTSRILGPYMNEAAHLLFEGAAVDAIDDAMTRFGFPVGPLKLLDEVGIDVAGHVTKIALDAFGARMTPPPGLDKIIADGRKGRKNQRGFYLYEGKKKGVDETVYDLLPGRRDRKPVEAREIQDRCALAMVNEAVRCLDDGILLHPRDGDIGAIFGLGFPPFLGGPFRYLDVSGSADIVRRLEELAGRHGPRFEPAQGLSERARSGQRFYQQL